LQSALLAAIVFLASIIPTYLLFDFMSGPTAGSSFWFLFFYAVGPIVASAALAVVLFTREMGVDYTRVSQEEPLNLLRQSLRASMLRVSESPGLLEVRLDWFAAIHISTKVSDEKTRLFVKARPTASGWTTLFFLILLSSSTYGIFFALANAMTVYISARCWYFRRRLPMILSEKRLVRQVPLDETRAALIEALSENHRLAAEAYEARKSNRQDVFAILLLVGIVLFLVLFVAILMTIDGFDDFAQMGLAATLAVVGAAALTAPLALVALHFSGRKVKEFEFWARQLRDALQRETEASPMEDGERTSVELLLDAWKELPKWMEARMKTGHLREPGTWIVISILLLMAVPLILTPLPNIGVAETLIGGSMIGAAFVLYARFKKRQTQESERILNELRSRLDLIRSQLEAEILGS